MLDDDSNEFFTHAADPSQHGQADHDAAPAAPTLRSEDEPQAIHLLADPQLTLAPIRRRHLDQNTLARLSSKLPSPREDYDAIVLTNAHLDIHRGTAHTMIVALRKNTGEDRELYKGANFDRAWGLAADLSQQLQMPLRIETVDAKQRQPRHVLLLEPDDLLLPLGAHKPKTERAPRPLTNFEPITRGRLRYSMPPRIQLLYYAPILSCALLAILCTLIVQFDLLLLALVALVPGCCVLVFLPSWILKIREIPHTLSFDAAGISIAFRLRRNTQIFWHQIDTLLPAPAPTDALMICCLKEIQWLRIDRDDCIPLITHITQAARAHTQTPKPPASTAQLPDSSAPPSSHGR